MEGALQIFGNTNTNGAFIGNPVTLTTFSITLLFLKVLSFPDARYGASVLRQTIMEDA